MTTDTVLRSDVDSRISEAESRSGAPDTHPELPDIPLGRYTDQAFFEREVADVFGAGWLFAGHASEWEEPGSYRVVGLPGGELVVVRGRDGQLRAFRNACRHRGAPVVRDAQGTARLLRCQFHSWTYDLAGRLVNVPCQSDFPHLCREERSLSEVSVGEWAGLVFLNLSATPPPLDAWLAPVADRFETFFDGGLRLVKRCHVDVDANWKVVVEAFLEVYHLNTVHRHTASQFARPGDVSVALHAGGHSTMYMPYSDELVNADDTSPVKQAMFPPDLPALGDPAGVFEATNVLFSLFPNLVAPVSPQGFPIVQAWPTAVDTTRFEVHWIGPDWGDGARPDGWETKFAAWDIVLDEDMANLGPIQRSLESAAHGGVPVGYNERAIWHLHAALDHALGLVPADLRVPDLLSAEVVA